MNNLKQVITLNNIANNTNEENNEIFNAIMQLRLECGCYKYYVSGSDNRKIFNQSKYCCRCCELHCENTLFGGYCLDCIKNKYIKIDVFVKDFIRDEYMIHIHTKKRIITNDRVRYIGLDEGLMEFDDFAKLIKSSCVNNKNYNKYKKLKVIVF